MTPLEQLILEMTNRARLNPAAEAARLGIALNEGPPLTPLTAAAKQPLAPNARLDLAADRHSLHMLAVDKFAHDGIGDGTPDTRVVAAGYVLTPPAGVGENIAFKGTTGAVNQTLFAIQNYEQLFIDAGIPGRGHRVNILNDAWREVGTGLQFGDFTQNGTTFHSGMLTQDFAFAGNKVFVTGVAIRDLDHDNFYDIGEGRGGVHVTVKAGAATVGTDITEAAGGYGVATPAGGNLSVTFSGGGLPVAVTALISTGLRNAKVDLLDNSEILSSATTTLGAGARDLGLLGVAALNGTGNNLANAITGNAGANILKGLGGNDVITGGAGKDTMDGGLGADRFDFNSVGESRRGPAHDVVTFSRAQHDKLDVSTIDADTDGTAGNQAFAFIGAHAFSGVDGQLRYGAAPGGGVLLQGDTNGDRVADVEVHVKGVTSLILADLIL